MNAPDRFETFILADGEQKITEKIDTRTPNTSVFTINKEDHTLANLIRAELCKDPGLIPFCGYKGWSATCCHMLPHAATIIF